MYYVIQDNVFDEPFFDKLIGFLKKVGLPYDIVQAVPFTGEIVSENGLRYDLKGETVAIGSYSFTDKMKADGWYPGSWVNENYDARVWLEKWPCLNGDAKFHNFGEVPHFEKPKFIRPCKDTKDFTGQVFDWGEFKEWQERVLVIEKETYTYMGKDTPVLVANPKKIEAEWRMIVVDGVVITGSLYKTGTLVSYKEVSWSSDPTLFAFASRVIEEWTPSRVFALDVCMSDGMYYVLEMGNINSAGLYECDVQRFIETLEMENEIHGF